MSTRVVSAEIRIGNRYLLTKRLPTSVLPDLWEFPGGRVREGETDEAALRRTLVDRIGTVVRVGEQVQEVHHETARGEIVLTVYRCALDGEPEARRVADVAWVLPEDFGNYPFPPADQHSIELLLADMG